MSGRRRGRDRQTGARRQPATSGSRLRQWAVPWGVTIVAALTVTIPLQPTEANDETGSEAVVMVMWMMLALVASVVAWLASRRNASGSGRKQAELQDAGESFEVASADECPVILGIVVALAGWVVLSGFVAGPAGHFRPVLNCMGQWAAMVTGFLVMVRLFRWHAARRAVLVMALAAAAVSALWGIHEWKWVHPQVVRQYERDPAGVMRKAGVIAEPGTPAWKQFRDRLMSTEPYGTFGLPNSLAGFLATWLVVGTGMLFMAIASRPQRIEWIGLLATMVLTIGFCLTLTKSRTAWLAALVGLVGLVLSPLARRSRGAVALAGGLVVGGLLLALAALSWADPLVISEAPLSVRYRLEYWMGCVAIAKDHPWFGCGVGNFQEFYPQYMQPWSSETVADPHNFWFELLATAGVPAALIALIVVAAAIGLARAARGSQTGGSVSPDRSRERLGVSGRARQLSRGQLALMTAGGGLLALPALGIRAILQGQFVEIELIGIALVVVVGTAIGAFRWCRLGELPRNVIGWGLATWGINACAAGAIGIWGVAHSGWLLLALWVSTADPITSRRVAGIGLPKWKQLARWWRPVSVVASLVGLVAVWTLVHAPVYRARRALLRADSSTILREAERWYLAAADADSWWSLPWERVAELRWRRYLANPDERGWQQFQRATREALARNRHSAVLYRQIGDWNLWAFVASDSTRRRGGDQMVAAYRRAAEFHPANAFYHAQLAWAYHLVGESRRAADEARRALELDALVPHEELRLEHRRLVEGPQGSTMTAERRMRQLRSKEGSDHPEPLTE